METIRSISKPQSNRGVIETWVKKQEIESTKAFNSALEKEK